MRIFTVVNNALIKTEVVLMAALTCVCTLAIFLQVICRYVLFIPVPWAEELARYTFIWLCWIGCASAMARRKHIEMDLLDTMLAKAPNRKKVIGRVIFIGVLVSVAFLVVFAVIYGQFYGKTLAGNQHSTAMNLHYGWPMGALLAGTVLMIFHGVYNLIARRGYGIDEILKEEDA